MSTNFRVAAVFAFSGLLAACSHNSNTVPAVQTGSTQSTIVSNVGGGTFVQYSLPAGVSPLGITRGPYSTIWFASNVATVPGGEICRLLSTNGTVHCFNLPSDDFGFVNWESGIVGANGAVFWLLASTNFHDSNFLGRITPTASISTFPLFGDEDTIFSNLAVGSDGRIWFGFCIAEGDCSQGSALQSISTTGVGGPGAFLSGLLADAITPGPGGNIYAAGTIQTAPPMNPCSPCDAVKVVSTSGTVLHTFALNDNGPLPGIVTGSDGNLWITEPDINKIARMTPSGTVKQFNVPTAHAGLGQITYGENATLWFIETSAHKIGRITTSGVVTEFPIPFANAGLGSIAPCTTECPPNGGLWFTVTNHIGKFIAP